MLLAKSSSPSTSLSAPIGIPRLPAVSCLFLTGVGDADLSTLGRRLRVLLGVADSVLPRSASSSGETVAVLIETSGES